MATFDEVLKVAGYASPPEAGKKPKKEKDGTPKLDTGEYIPTAQGVRRIKLESGGFLRPALRTLRSALSGANSMRPLTDSAAAGINSRKSYKDVE